MTDVVQEMNSKIMKVIAEIKYSSQERYNSQAAAGAIRHSASARSKSRERWIGRERVPRSTATTESRDGTGHRRDVPSRPAY